MASFADRVRYLITGTVKENPAQPAISRDEPSATTKRSPEIVQAYEDVEIVRRCIEIIVNAVVEIPFSVDLSDAKGDAQHRPSIANYYKLLSIRPNPFEDRISLFRRATLDFLLTGNAYFYYDKDSKHLYVLPAHNIEIVSHPKTFIEKYVYLPNGKVKKPKQNVGNLIPFQGYMINQPGTSLIPTNANSTYDTEAVEFLPEEIIHIKDDNSKSIYLGRSRIDSLKDLINIYHELLNFQKQFFENDAVPGTVLKTENALSEHVKERLKSDWKSSYTSLSNGARSPVVLDNGLDIDRIADINFKELDFENSVERLQQDIAKALGVPYVLLKSQGNANLAANQIVFYTHTILPICQQFASAFTHYFQGTKIKPDVTDVTALQPDLRTQSQYFTALVNAGIITPNEAREKLGYPILNSDGMSNIRIPQNITGSATNPDVGGRPENSEVEDIPEDASNGEE